jgi:hypothetical protein
MDLMILKKKLDGFRGSNGAIREVAPEVLWELRQGWENFTGSIEEFRSAVGVKIGTLRNLLKEAKKLNHVLASAESVALSTPSPEEGSQGSERTVGDGVVYDLGHKTIRFPSVETLIDFLRKAA